MCATVMVGSAEYTARWATGMISCQISNSFEQFDLQQISSIRTVAVHWSVFTDQCSEQKRSTKIALKMILLKKKKWFLATPPPSFARLTTKWFGGKVLRFRNRNRSVRWTDFSFFWRENLFYSKRGQIRHSTKFEPFKLKIWKAIELIKRSSSIPSAISSSTVFEFQKFGLLFVFNHIWITWIFNKNSRNDRDSWSPQ